jgi:hypothetical protein
MWADGEGSIVGVMCAHLERQLREMLPAAPADGNGFDQIGTTGAPDYTTFGDLFLPVVAQVSAFDSLGFRSAPPGTRVGLEASGATPATWVTEAAPIPATTLAPVVTTLDPGKIGLLGTLTREIAQSREEAAVQHVQRWLAGLIGIGTDAVAFDPADPNSLGSCGPGAHAPR